MKIYLQILTFGLITLVPATIIAQESANGTIQKPITRFYSAGDSVLAKQDLQITSILPSKRQSAFPYKYSLQTSLLKIGIKICISNNLK